MIWGDEVQVNCVQQRTSDNFNSLPKNVFSCNYKLRVFLCVCASKCEKAEEIRDG